MFSKERSFGKLMRSLTGEEFVVVPPVLAD